MEKSIEELFVGKIVGKIYMEEEQMFFIFGDGSAIFCEVEADCCSNSYFFDFYGVKNVLGNEIIRFEKVDLAPGDVGYRKETFEVVGANEYEEIQVYGYRITTMHDMFGEVSAVFSFRNSSNGYYGGWMEAKELQKFPSNRSFKEESWLFDDKTGE